MPSTTLYSAQDVIDSLLDWSGSGTTDAQGLRKIKRAILASYREVASVRNWSYFYTRGRLTTNAQYNTGTVTYTQSNLSLTLSGGAWPAWAAFGVIQLSGVEYQVATRSSDTVLILSLNANPGADIATASPYYLWQDTYALPVDFKAAGIFKDASNSLNPEFIEPNNWVRYQRTAETPNMPRYYTIMADPKYMGAMAWRCLPPPNNLYRYDYIYLRYPRQLLTWQYTPGTVTTSTSTVTGVGMAWTSAMLGSIIRFSGTTTALTGTAGENPFVAERIVTSVDPGGLSLTIDSALTNELSGVAYQITDPIDIEQGAMYTAFIRKCEYEYALQLRRDDSQKLLQLYAQAERLAMEADSRSFDTKPGSPFRRRQLLVDPPYTLNT